MPEAPRDPQHIFLDRIDRRVKILATLLEAGLGVYLPAEEPVRRKAIEQVVRLTARPTELPLLTPETLRTAYRIVETHLEAMQRTLPHDVQYRNRLRKNW